MLLDIGGDVGALVVTMPEAMVGEEVEIARPDARSPATTARTSPSCRGRSPGARCRRWSSPSWSRAATPWCRREPMTSGCASMSAGERSPRPPGRADTGRALVCGGWPTPPPQTWRLVEAVRRSLAAAGDPDVAAQQQSYMKSAMPYYGLPAPRLRAELRPLLRDWVPAGRGQWEATVRTLWDEATHREEWYAAIAVARHRRATGVGRPGQPRPLAAPGRDRGVVGRRRRRGHPPGR